MAQSKGNKICRGCNYCKRLYVKRGVKYYREKKLYCTLHENRVCPDDRCEMWQEQKTEYDLSLQRLDSVIDDINFLLGRLE